MPNVFISAAETSADMHGAALIRAIRRLRPDVRFFGVAGPAMQAAGCKNLFDFTRHSAMLTGAFKQVFKGIRLLRQIRARLRADPWDALVVIDSPVLHLPVTKMAKRVGIPVLYYVAPQLWAWGAWRMAKLRKNTDAIAAILPFEEAFFQNHGCRVRYVGHPLFDTLAARPIDPAKVDSLRTSGQPLIAVLPGSRQHVIEEVLPGQLEVARAILQAHPNACVHVSVARPELRNPVQAVIGRSGTISHMFEGNLGELLSAATLTLVASGTATLEVGYYGSPMIVMYNGSKWLYHLVGKRLIKTRHLSLINIVADRQVVPEFMPYYDSTEPITASALELLGSEARASEMRRQVKSVVQLLGQGSASDKAAAMLLELLR